MQSYVHIRQALLNVNVTVKIETKEGAIRGKMMVQSCRLHLPFHAMVVMEKRQCYAPGMHNSLFA